AEGAPDHRPSRPQRLALSPAEDAEIEEHGFVGRSAREDDVAGDGSNAMQTATLSAISTEFSTEISAGASAIYSTTKNTM
ncbi:MAG: hypothetical protein ACRYGP_16985, partial [Janthinobacterium lividum]